VAEGQEDIVAVIDGVRSNRTYNDRYHAHNSLSKLVGYGKAKVAELYINGEKVEHFELGKKYIDFEPKSLDSTMSEGSGVTKLNDYDTWLDQVDLLGAEKHMQKNQTMIVAQSWDGDQVGEFDIKRNQGWVMSPGISEGVEKYLEELSRAGYEVITETAELCPECGGPAFSDQLLAEKKDACYSKVKSRYKVWPSAYASGALVRCRKVGAKNWGNKSKK